MCKKIKILFTSSIFLILTINISAQQIIDLYKDSIPNSNNSNITEINNAGIYSNITNPTLEIFSPDIDKAKGKAIIICPGGGYGAVVYNGEGISTAKELAKKGITAFVLKYRLPNDSIMIDKKYGPMQDVQRAIKIVRENAAKWNINSNEIGIMGFSAGGHLASTAATHFNDVQIKNINSTNLRPDFQILIYPVISMKDALTHEGSRNNLLGPNPTQEVVEYFSNEIQVNEDTPPAYITHAADDGLVDVDNSIVYFEKLRKSGVPVEMYIYPEGNHGFVLRQPFEKWVTPIVNWLENIANR